MLYPARGARPPQCTTARRCSSIKNVIYTADSEKPWFGELALWSNKARPAAAIASVPTTLGVVRAAQFGACLQLVPALQEVVSGATAKLQAGARGRMQRRRSSLELYGKI